MDFVVGHPRSGTNLVANLLNLACSGVAQHELLVCQTRGAHLIEAATAYYEGEISGEVIKALFAGRHHGPSLRIDSSWKNTWILPPLLELHPSARFLHLVRDPRSNVIACHNLDYYGQLESHPALQKYEMVRWLAAMPRVRHPEWEALSPFAKNCLFWAETQRLILDTLSSRTERYALIRLEDLGRADVVAGLYRFFGLPQPPEGAIARVLSTPVNTKLEDKNLLAPLKGDLLPPFADCPAEIQETLRRISGPIAARLGYTI